MKPQEYVRRKDEIGGWPVTVVTYRLGERRYCKVDNVDPGALIARAEGASREEAEQEALEKATRRLGRTRRFSAE